MTMSTTTFTPKELAFLTIHAEFFRRPHDWSPERAGDPASTFAPVRSFLAGLLQFEPGPFRKACESLRRANVTSPTLADLRDAYFRVLGEARRAMAEARQAKHRAGSAARGQCSDCNDTGTLRVLYVRLPTGHLRVVTARRPAYGTVYETLVPCLCEAGRTYAEEHRVTYSAEQRRSLAACACRTQQEACEIRAACAAAPRGECSDEGGIDDATVDWALGDAQ